MTPQHHPGDATILAYAAGALGEGLSLVVASHLALCPDCRTQVADGEVIGGALLDDLAPAPLAAGVRERVLLKLDGAAPIRVEPPRPQISSDPLVPEPFSRYLQGGAASFKWRLLGPGLRQFEILPHERLGGGNLRMLRIAPGKKLPRHGHSGTELTLVLRGSFTDELGRFSAGDVAETDTDIVHEPASDRGEDCICIIATEVPLKFESPIARALQLFSGF
jgi:putative transcriptional regulator